MFLVTMLYARLAQENLQKAVNTSVSWSEVTPELAPTAEEFLR